jgi:hypothetical protein
MLKLTALTTVILLAVGITFGAIVVANGWGEDDVPKMIDHGYVCEGAVEWVAYEGGPPPKEVKRQAEDVYTPKKCEELKLLNTCQADGDSSDCPRLTD